MIMFTLPYHADKGTEYGLLPDADSIPIDLEKMKDLGFFNGIFEIDLCDEAWDWDEFTVENLCELMKVCRISYHNHIIIRPDIPL